MRSSGRAGARRRPTRCGRSVGCGRLEVRHRILGLEERRAAHVRRRAEDDENPPAVRERAAHRLRREVRLGVLDAPVELALGFVVGRGGVRVELLPEPEDPLPPRRVVSERRELLLLGFRQEEGDRGGGPRGVARVLGDRAFVRQRRAEVGEPGRRRRRRVAPLGGRALRVEEDAVALRVRAGVDGGLGLELEVARELLPRPLLVLPLPGDRGRVEVVGGEDLRQGRLAPGRGGELEEAPKRGVRVVPALLPVGLLRLEEREEEGIFRGARRRLRRGGPRGGEPGDDGGPLGNLCRTSLASAS